MKGLKQALPSIVVIAIVVGTVLYLLLGLVFHPLVVGRAVFGRPAF